MPVLEAGDGEKDLADGSIDAENEQSSLEESATGLRS